MASNEPTPTSRELSPQPHTTPLEQAAIRAIFVMLFAYFPRCTHLVNHHGVQCLAKHYSCDANACGICLTQYANRARLTTQIRRTPRCLLNSAIYYDPIPNMRLMMAICMIKPRQHLIDHVAYGLDTPMPSPLSSQALSCRSTPHPMLPPSILLTPVSRAPCMMPAPLARCRVPTNRLDSM